MTRLKLATKGTFRSLQHGNFRIFFITQGISFTGTWVQLAAQTLLVYRLTDSGTALGLLTAIQFAPTLFLGAWAGVVIDRHDKRRLMLVTSTVMGAAAAALALLVLTGQVSVGWVYLLAGVLGLANTFDNPARRTLVNDLVPADDLVNAIRSVLGPRAGPAEFARLFQAVRIAVNGELEGLARALPAFRDALAPGGRLAVITYHSGEDRTVKHAFRDWASACICPPGQPVCTCRGRPLGRVVPRKPVVPDAAEIAANPRARSAKLRIVERVVCRRKGPDMELVLCANRAGFEWLAKVFAQREQGELTFEEHTHVCDWDKRWVVKGSVSLNVRGPVSRWSRKARGPYWETIFKSNPHQLPDGVGYRTREIWPNQLPTWRDPGLSLHDGDRP